ncbi:ATP-dependent metalloprotease FtsH [Candidatus Phycorickettsia trachydisci]|uniref:ATP-dependent zinc metalloprotease FtsH n=1 Tax=Candidatus Phycorickettsia trachydisci TaxID=2115978 RepID=A0A2P1P7R3_9RICK|nr:ATP-dependent zinc metalloprotease FtsH [Candidatus Phycorickettsia trachydisci]AVP87301.1 ATP-dependent metalloprotease FtsH [Candidatus Phycorickettsia trachydisci]
MNNQTKNLLIWGAIVVAIVLFLNLSQMHNWSEGTVKLSMSEFLNKVEDKQVVSAKIQGRNIEGRLTDGVPFETYVGEYNVAQKLHENNVNFEIVPPDTKMNSLFSIFISWFPMLLLIGVWVFFMRQMQSGGGRAMGFGRSKAKLMSDRSKVTFKDVAGIDEAKEELTEIVDFLRDPSRFQRLGGRIPKGCLLIGPPGTGKTLLARAIAGEANVPFFSISGSDFVEMFVGVGASRVRDMFEQGKRNAPCIIFIDEIDAVGRHRGIGLGGGNDEREQTLNQMLVEMDGFESNDGVIIIAATNRPDVLDHALLRPGRFDRRIMVSNPDINGREQILKVHLKKIRYSSNLDIRSIAKGTPGFSGAELSNLVNESALLAARKHKKEVDTADLEQAKDKVIMGPERKSMILSEEDKQITAYHEAGHAIVNLFAGASHPIHKVTIVPRGNALGLVSMLPEQDEVHMKKNKANSDLAVAMGGRVAEEIIFGADKITSGASSDIKYATSIAKSMVMQWGMSEKVGPVLHSDSEDAYTTGHKGIIHPSEYMLQIIDEEIKGLVNSGYQRAKQILTENVKSLHLLASKLLESETLTGEEVRNLVFNGDTNTEAKSAKEKEETKPKKIRKSPKIEPSPA